MNSTNYTSQLHQLPTDYYYDDPRDVILMPSVDFLDVYYSPVRFGVETLCAALAAASNLTVLVAVQQAHRLLVTPNSSRTSGAYSLLFVNLTVANILSCVLSWLSNNSLFLFSDQLVELLNTDQCRFIIALMAAVFVSSAFGIVSTLTLLGFSVVQYLAVRRTVFQPSLDRRRVVVFIAASWTFSVLGSLTPFAAMLLAARGRPCDDELRQLTRRVVLYGVDACAAFVIVVYAAIFALCTLIYRRIRRVHGALVRYGDTSDVRTERRAFGTIGLMLATLGAFFVPYMTTSLNRA